MSFKDAVRSILGIKPVKIKEVTASIPHHDLPERPSFREVQETISDIEVIPEYSQVMALLKEKVPLIFVTGGAGTCKSTLIRYLKHVIPSHTAVVAPTGVAALNVGGMTIHSLFRLPPKIIEKEDVKQVYDRQLFEHMELLIIDEISMVRPDVLDGVDYFLRLNRRTNSPFGGVKVLLIGDLFQLPPVVTKDDRPMLRSMSYISDFFFNSFGLNDCSMVPIFLTRVFRQTDPDFINLMNNLREGRNLDETLYLLNARCTHKGNIRDQELILTARNASADERNILELSSIQAESKSYNGFVTGKFDINKTRLPSPSTLVLKKGAQVMFTKNDTNKRWVNGTIGKVVELWGDAVTVLINDSTFQGIVDVRPVTWSQYSYRFDPDEDRFVYDVVGTYTQIPLMLAWAITIHKAQGKTLDKIFVDLGTGAFASGQVYVALSRVRSINDLRLARPIEKNEIILDPVIVSFYRQLRKLTQLDDETPEEHKPKTIDEDIF